MPRNTFTPNTTIQSSKVNQNFQDLEDHSLHFTMKWSFLGTLQAETSNDWLALPDDGTIERVDLIVATAPTGQELIVDIEKSTDSGGTWNTIFTTSSNRPQVAAGSRTGNSTSIDVPGVTALTAYFRAKIAQVGSSVAGANLSVMVRGTYDLV